MKESGVKHMSQSRTATENRRYTVIIGCGRLGASLADSLAGEEQNVLIIDCRRGALRKLSPAYGGLTLVGDATDIDVLKEAKLEKATAVIVVTNDDNTNIMIAQLACALFAGANVIARLYDPQCGDICHARGIDTICPAALSADEIRRQLSNGGEEADHEEKGADCRRIS